MRFISLAPFLPMLLGGSGQSIELYPRRIEVFTTTDTQVTGIPSLHISQGHFQFEQQTYVLDAIERIEYAGAARFFEFAGQSDICLYI